jgi:hypothetical protein
MTGRNEGGQGTPNICGAKQATIGEGLLVSEAKKNELQIMAAVSPQSCDGLDGAAGFGVEAISGVEGYVGDGVAWAVGLAENVEMLVASERVPLRVSPGDQGWWVLVFKAREESLV